MLISNLFKYFRKIYYLNNGERIMSSQKEISLFAFFLLTVITITLKTYFSYYVDFSLGVKGLVQNLILLMNPYSLVALVLSVFLFFKGKKHFGSCS